MDWSAEAPEPPKAAFGRSGSSALRLTPHPLAQRGLCLTHGLMPLTEGARQEGPCFKMARGVPTRMAEMRLTVQHTLKGHALECTTPAGAKILFDGGEGSAETGATPMQHLLASLGACALMDVEVILRKKRLTFTNLRVDCVGTRQKMGETNPFVGAMLVFRVEGDVPEKAFADAVKLSVEKYCSVEATLAKATPVQFETLVDPKT